MKYEEAFAVLIQRKAQLDFLPKIIDIDFDAGGDYQIGDMTWGHDDASLTVRYRDPAQTPGKTFTYYVDLEYYGVAPYGEPQREDTGFAGLMNDLLEIANEDTDA